MSAALLFLFDFSLALALIIILVGSTVATTAFAIPTDRKIVVMDSWDIGTFIKLSNTGNTQGMATDFAGNIYFAEQNANKIARLSPDTNTVTEWTIPTRSSGPTGIAFDSSTGNLYFAENNTNKIGRLVPSSGAFSEWAINSKPSNALFISSPGNVYFISENRIINRLS